MSERVTFRAPTCATGYILSQKMGIGYHQKDDAVRQLDFASEWYAFADACNRFTTDVEIQISADHAWEVFVHVMTQSYRDEAHLDQALFSALKSLLGTAIEQNTPDNVIVFPCTFEVPSAPPGTVVQKRVGFTSSVQQFPQYPKSSSNDEAAGASTAMYDDDDDMKSYHHACFLFDSDYNNPMDPLAVVAINSNLANCEPFSLADYYAPQDDRTHDERKANMTSPKDEPKNTAHVFDDIIDGNNEQQNDEKEQQQEQQEDDSVNPPPQKRQNLLVVPDIEHASTGRGIEPERVSALVKPHVEKQQSDSATNSDEKCHQGRKNAAALEKHKVHNNNNNNNNNSVETIGGGDGKAHKELCVRGLPYNLTKTHIDNLFHPFGTIVTFCQIKPKMDDDDKPGMCITYVAFADVESATAAMALHGTKYEGNTLSIYYRVCRIVDPELTDIFGTGGPISHILLPIIKSVLPALALNGIQPHHVPWLVLAGKTQTKADSGENPPASVPLQALVQAVSPEIKDSISNILMFAFGSLSMPRRCGGTLRYSVDAHGCYMNRNDPKRAMAAYLHVLKKGLDNAEQCIVGINQKQQYWLSGCDLSFAGTVVADVKLEASPFEENSKIHQGELLSGMLCLDEVRRNISPSGFAVILPKEAQTIAGKSRLLFKVSSLFVCDTLISPQEAYYSIERVFTKTTAPLVYDVLLAAERPTMYSCITVMRDLSQDGYVPLKPVAHEKKMGTLWKMFTKLVNEALLPMAEDCGVVFTDLRIGWDRTYNVWVQESTMNMRLIDYESLATSFGYPEQKNAFHVKHDNCQGVKYSCVRFLWWQCIVLADCLSKKILYADFSCQCVVDQLRKRYEDSDVICGAFGQLPREHQSAIREIARHKYREITGEHINNTLNWLQSLFVDVE